MAKGKEAEEEAVVRLSPPRKKKTNRGRPKGFKRNFAEGVKPMPPPMYITRRGLTKPLKPILAALYMLGLNSKVDDAKFREIVLDSILRRRKGETAIATILRRMDEVEIEHDRAAFVH